MYNEGAHLRQLATDWRRVFQLLQIRFVIRFYNDASTDEETVTLLNQLPKVYPDVEVIHSTVNRGHGPVLHKAYSEATRHTQWVFQIDGDHELACDAFAEMWLRRNEYDLLMGVRGGTYHDNIFRRLITQLAGMLVTVFFGRKLSDVNCPYRLMRTSWLQQAITCIPPNAFAPNVLLVAYAVQKNARMFFAPVSHTSLKKPQRRWQPPWRMLRGSIAAAMDLLRIRFRM
ncbi:MAG: glycosyltransferase family 2 protein [Lacibacter sp.]